MCHNKQKPGVSSKNKIKPTESYPETGSERNKWWKMQRGTGGERAAADSFEYILIDPLHIFHAK